MRETEWTSMDTEVTVGRDSVHLVGENGGRGEVIGRAQGLAACYSWRRLALCPTRTPLAPRDRWRQCRSSCGVAKRKTSAHLWGVQGGVKEEWLAEAGWCLADGAWPSAPLTPVQQGGIQCQKESSVTSAPHVGKAYCMS